MARGTVQVFEEATKSIVDGTHDLDTDTFKIAICDNTLAPTASTGSPALGLFTEVTAAGTYSTGGTALTISLAEVGGTTTWSFSNSPNWGADASNDTDAYWGIIYNDTNVGKEAIAYVDLGGPVDMQAGPLTINAGTIFTLSL